MYGTVPADLVLNLVEVFVNPPLQIQNGFYKFIVREIGLVFETSPSRP